MKLERILAIIGLAVVISLTTLSIHIARVATAARQQNTTYLCIESWKLGLRPKSCDEILETGNKP